MTIALALEMVGNNSIVSDLFGRCGFFMLYDDSNHTRNLFPNPFTSELGGAGIRTAQYLIEKNIDAVIVRQIGRNPLRFFLSANIKVYQTTENDVEKVIQLLNEGRLEVFDQSVFSVKSGRKRFRSGREF